MQKSKSPNSGLNKALIFVSAFVVSSLIIYQVYYYSKIKSLSSGLVATAAELPNTQISPLAPKHFSGINYMGNAGLLAAVSQTENSSFSAAPAESYLSGNGIYSKAFLDEINIGISNKFPNHPPIGFPAREGDKILFSYLFKNVVLPAGFADNHTIDVNGKHFRAIQYMAENNNASTKAYFYGDSLYLLYIPVDKEALAISKRPLPAGSIDSLLMKMSNVADWKKRIITFPEIDFNIIKYWKPEDALFIADVAGYKHIEERLKLKLSAAKTEKYNDLPMVELHPPFYIYLYKTNSAKPYLNLYIANTELLLPAKK